MLATAAGSLALLLGLLLLLLPLLVSELSRPRDSAWGALVLLLGLVLVTSSDRLTGAPMLAVLCAGLLIGRLGGEVAQGRWRALSDEERRLLASVERWRSSLHQLGAILAGLLEKALLLSGSLTAWLAERRQGQSRSHGKRWVRQETPVAGAEPARQPGSAEQGQTAASHDAPPEAAAPPSSDPGPPTPQDDTPPLPAEADLSPPSTEPGARSVAADPAPVQPSGGEPSEPQPPPAPPLADAAPLAVISDFSEVDALLDQAAAPSDAASAESP